MIHKELVLDVLENWDKYAHRLVDDARTTPELARLLKPQAGAAWYPGPTGGYFYIEPAGLFGQVTLLGDGDPKKWRHALREAILDLALVRLTAWVPSPANEYKGFLRAIGFRPEGRLKHSAVYNNTFTDLDVFGFMVDYKGPRRRRRGRRKKAKD